MPCFVGSRPDGCPLQHNRYISQVFLGIFIGYVANDIGIGIVQFVCKSIAREQCQYCSQKVYIKVFIFDFKYLHDCRSQFVPCPIGLSQQSKSRGTEKPNLSHTYEKGSLQL